jgi:hypothetical protein
VLGSTAVAVAARCNGPVVVVPESWAVPEHRTEDIVAGINGHSDSREDPVVDRARLAHQLEQPPQRPDSRRPNREGRGTCPIVLASQIIETKPGKPTSGGVLKPLS